MKRLLAGLVGAVLFSVPAAFVFTVLVPVAEYRQGTWADFGAPVASCATLYGGAAIGILVAWRWHERVSLTAARVFRAGFWGGVIATLVVLSGQSLYQGLVGEFEGMGNLWGLVPIFGAAFSALVAGGAGLAWYAVRGSKDARH
jgi:hypothetical protein